MVALFVGTGVGGGIVLDRRVYHGARGGAGEIGHVVVAAGGPMCGCGQPGCVEAMAARGAVARYVQEMVAAGRTTVLSEALKGNLASLTSRDLRIAIQQGDEVALEAARKSAWYVGLAVGGLVNTLDPDLVVLGGGIAEAPGAAYVQWVAEAARPQILAKSARDIPIVASVLGDDAGLLGAALSALEGLADSSPSSSFSPA
jgi:glucokinase